MTMECEVCGCDVTISPSEAPFRRTCSYGCSATLRQRERQGAANPNFRRGASVGVRNRPGERRWGAAPKGMRCAVPGCPSNGRIHMHHIVYRQHVVREGGDVWDTRNGMPLCTSCHSSHHHGGRVILVAILPTSVFEFARELMGAGAAYEYIARRYEGTDSRLEGLRKEADGE